MSKLVLGTLALLALLGLTAVIVLAIIIYQEVGDYLRCRKYGWHTGEDK